MLKLVLAVAFIALVAAEPITPVWPESFKMDFNETNNPSRKKIKKSLFLFIFIEKRQTGAKKIGNGKRQEKKNKLTQTLRLH
jgi:hypothetical protein